MTCSELEEEILRRLYKPLKLPPRRLYFNMTEYSRGGKAINHKVLREHALKDIKNPYLKIIPKKYKENLIFRPDVNVTDYVHKLELEPIEETEEPVYIAEPPSPIFTESFSGATCSIETSPKYEERVDGPSLEEVAKIIRSLKGEKDVFNLIYKSTPNPPMIYNPNFRG